MALIVVTISAPVGIRNGTIMLQNAPTDLGTITDLFDRISSSDGGTADVPGEWPQDRSLLILEVANTIGSFQFYNSLTIDSALDPRGHTLTKMNELAADPPLVAQVLDMYSDINLETTKGFASVASVPGTRRLQVDNSSTIIYSRFVVGLAGSTINWFGVVIPNGVVKTLSSAVTHIFFTPTPDQHPPQGSASDKTYKDFSAGWVDMWDEYTTAVGGQVAAARVNQIVVIPFYRYSQTEKMGGFLSDWADALTSVIQAAVAKQDPNVDASVFSVGSIVSSSFSNGIRAHRHFQSAGMGTTVKTKAMFDLDGGASGTEWAPAGMTTYRNTAVPKGVNPVGSKFFVSGRWQNFRAIDSQFQEHWGCVDNLLMHGVFTHCRFT